MTKIIRFGIDMACYLGVIIALTSLGIRWTNWQYWVCLFCLFILQVNPR